jgi:hypothetical protein
MDRDELLEKLNITLGKESAGNIAIYGCNDMSAILYSVLKNTENPPKAFIDKYASQNTFCQCSVQTFENFNKNDFDTIIVSNYAYFKNIERDLRFYEFSGKVIAYNEIFAK